MRKKKKGNVMNRPPIVHIVGKKRSGKTDLMIGLIRSLSAKGYTVASVRHSSYDHAVDTDGTDTMRYKQAGAGGAALVTASETNLFVPTEDWDGKVSVLRDVFFINDL